MATTWLDPCWCPVPGQLCPAPPELCCQLAQPPDAVTAAAHVRERFAAVLNPSEADLPPGALTVGVSAGPGRAQRRRWSHQPGGAPPRHFGAAGPARRHGRVTPLVRLVMSATFSFSSPHHSIEARSVEYIAARVAHTEVGQNCRPVMRVTGEGTCRAGAHACSRQMRSVEMGTTASLSETSAAPCLSRDHGR
jgi:hypothetical protein